jgi:hypothetical protein
MTTLATHIETSTDYADILDTLNKSQAYIRWYGRSVIVCDKFHQGEMFPMWKLARLWKASINNDGEPSQPSEPQKWSIGERVCVLLKEDGQMASSSYYYLITGFILDVFDLLLGRLGGLPWTIYHDNCYGSRI